MIHRYIDANEICHGNLSGLQPGEIDEARRQLAQGALHLARVPVPAPEPPRIEDRWLTVEQACERFCVKRRWLFENRNDLPFVRNDSRKAMCINEQAAVRYFARKRLLR
jgi:hypothetical protein